ncbi:MAG: thiamine pyrophosphate-binding protein [Bacteroidales bacterium]|nr:thiamine pyrophosphate-binding protein [Bacteroidales bacterium]
MNKANMEIYAQLVARILSDYGCKYVFGAPGTTELSLCTSIESHPKMKYITCLHENVAIGMAEGVSRAGETLGVANLHATQGTLNGMGSIRASYRDGIPMLVISGFPATYYSIYEPNHFQYGLTDILRHITKWAWEIDNPLQVSTAVRRAIEIALSPPMGPTFLGIPQNILEMRLDTMSNMKSTFKDWSPPSYVPSDDELREALSIIKKAKSILIYSGNEVGKSGSHSVSLIGRLAEILGAVVIGEAMDRGPMIQSVNSPMNHSLFAGYFDSRNPYIRDAISSCDTFIEIGVKTTYEKVIGELSTATNIIQIDYDPHQLGKNHPVNVGMVGDIDKTLQRVLELIQQKPIKYTQKNKKRSKELALKSRKWRPKLDTSSTDFRIILDLLEVLGNEMPQNGVVVDDSQSFGYFLKSYFPFSEDIEIHGSLASHMGWALPVALGFGLSKKNRKVLCIVGDGSTLFSLQSFATAAKYKVPIVILVINNSGFRSLQVESEKKGWLKHTRDALSLTSPRIRLTEVATSFGIKAKSPSTKIELRDAFREAFHSDTPCLIEIEAPTSLDFWRQTWLVQ